MNIPLDSDDEDQLLLGRDVEAALLLGEAVEADLLTLGIAVLLDVLLSTLEDNGALLLVELYINVSLKPMYIEAYDNICIDLSIRPERWYFATALTLSSCKWFYASRRYFILFI